MGYQSVKTRTCEKCGMEETSPALERYVLRRGIVRCASCRATKRNKIHYATGVCRPWHGNFDENDNPLDELGNLYMPGPRNCNHRDCVAPNHVEKENPDG